MESGENQLCLLSVCGSASRRRMLRIALFSFRIELEAHPTRAREFGRCFSRYKFGASIFIHHPKQSVYRAWLKQSGTAESSVQFNESYISFDVDVNTYHNFHRTPSFSLQWNSLVYTSFRCDCASISLPHELKNIHSNKIVASIYFWS